LTTKAHEMVAQQAAIEAKSKDQQKFDNIDAGRAFARSILESNPHLYWDQQADRWFEHINNNWVDYASNTMEREYAYALPTADHKSGFMSEMYAEQHRRKRKGQVFDFNLERVAADYPHCINRAIADTWLKPMEGELHPAFEWLLDCLASDRKDEREHIEKCIYWKHKNPAEFKMPALVLFGGAGNGKGILSEHVLKNIFTPEHYTMVAGGPEIVRNFQDPLVGKAIFLFDEANCRSAADSDWLKAHIMKESIQVNQKGIKSVKTMMQIWFHIFNNSPLHSPVAVTGTDVDRRYSLIRTKKVWWHYIAEQLDLGPVKVVCGENDEVDCSETKEAAMDVLNSDLMPNVFKNPVELAKFLGYLYAKWGYVVTTCPIAFHGEDYRALLDNAQTTEDTLFEDVFMFDSKFLSISEQALYDLYRYRAEKDGVNHKFVKSKSGLMTAAYEFIDRKGLGIKHSKTQRYNGNGTRSPVLAFALTKREGRQLRHNDNDYMPTDWKPTVLDDIEFNSVVEGRPGIAKVRNLSMVFADAAEDRKAS
jgi:hypothetical protein